MKVFKFGGASVKDAESFKNVAEILSVHDTENLYVIVSAMGKTTNHLERLLMAHYSKNESAKDILEDIRSFHYQIAQELLESPQELMEQLNDLFVEIEWVMEDEAHPDYHFEYDQVVSIGELLSTRILSAYLNEIKVKNFWVDARDLIQTNNQYGRAEVNWELSCQRINKFNEEKSSAYSVFVTQGFIGGTSENYTTTLGREGSDFSAAIFSFALDAEEMCIWKDVSGILNADPKIMSDAVVLDKVSYTEAIEMTYYGAKVIHPKTIKPLQNKNIPLYVKSFVEPDLEGTLIHFFEEEIDYPPVYVIEPNQSLIHISTKDFSFIAEKHLSQIFENLAQAGIRINLMRNTAISFTMCVTNDEKRMTQFHKLLSESFDITIRENLQLITVRHFTEASVQRMKEGKNILFEERLNHMIQLVVE